MLLDGPKHVRVFRNHLGGGCNIAVVKLVPLSSKTAPHRQVIQIIVDGFAMLLHAQLHITLFDRVFLKLLAVILRQLVKDSIIRIEHHTAVFVRQHFRSHVDSLSAQAKLIGVGVKLQIQLLQIVNGVREDRNTHGIAYIIIRIVDDIEFINHKLWLR